jgi:hypothetical protein
VVGAKIFIPKYFLCCRYRDLGLPECPESCRECLETAETEADGNFGEFICKFFNVVSVLNVSFVGPFDWINELVEL